MADLPPIDKNAPGAKANTGLRPLDGLVTLYVDGKVTVVPLRELTERAYGLGQLDGLAKAVEKVRRGLPGHWGDKAIEAIES